VLPAVSGKVTRAFQRQYKLLLINVWQLQIVFLTNYLLRFYLRLKIGWLKENRIYPVLQLLVICLKPKFRHFLEPGVVACTRLVDEVGE
jgi:hypothetical protein